MRRMAQNADEPNAAAGALALIEWARALARTAHEYEFTL